MTGGVAVVLGRTGRNFAAGMSGGIAYVYDPDDRFTHRCNLEMVDLFTVDDADSELEPLLQKHFDFTGSKIAKKILDDFANERPRFKKVYPKEYHHMLDTMARLKEAGTPEKELWLDAFEEAMSTAKGGH
jgi:glutamate synthase (NADPH/NADH) large chain